MTVNLAAMTESEPVSYPGYVSINKHEDENYSVTVRSRGAQLGSCIRLTREELQMLSDQLAAALAPPPVVKGK